METHFLLELLGYLASGLIVIAMMMSSILWLRMINTVGAAAFAVYGLLIHAYPVALLNGDYDRVWTATRQVVEAIAGADADGLLGDNAARVYRFTNARTTTSAGESAWRHR